MVLINDRIQGLKMSKSLKNYTTIRAVLSSQKEWTARSLRICFLLMPWQDGIEVTDALMKAVVGWEGKLNNFFLKALDISKHSNPGPEPPGAADQQLLSALSKAKTSVDTALRDSFNTPAVMRIISDLITESNSAETLSHHTIIQLAKWITRIIGIFGLDPEGDLTNPSRIGWSGLTIPAPAHPYIPLASQLRDTVRTLACSGPVSHAAILHLTSSTLPATTTIPEPSEPYNQVLQAFRADVKALATQQAPAKDLLTLCDHFRDTHLWNLGIYLEDRDTQPALVRALDRLLISSRAEADAVAAAKAEAKRAKEAKDAEAERKEREMAAVDPRVMFKGVGGWREWERQRGRFEGWLKGQKGE